MHACTHGCREHGCREHPTGTHTHMHARMHAHTGPGRCRLALRQRLQQPEHAAACTDAARSTCTHARTHARTGCGRRGLALQQRLQQPARRGLALRLLGLVDELRVNTRLRMRARMQRHTCGRAVCGLALQRVRRCTTLRHPGVPSSPASPSQRISMCVPRASSSPALGRVRSKVQHIRVRRACSSPAHEHRQMKFTSCTCACAAPACLQHVSASKRPNDPNMRVHPWPAHPQRASAPKARALTAYYNSM